MRALGMWTLVVVGLWACIEDAGSPGADDATVDGSFGDGFAARMAERGITAIRTDVADPLEAVKAYLATVTGGPAD